MKPAWKVWWQLIREERMIERVASDLLLAVLWFLLGAAATVEINNVDWNSFVRHAATWLATFYIAFNLVGVFREIRMLRKEYKRDKHNTF